MNFTDQLNRNVELQSFPPKRIISLVPSQTELLFDLGLREEVVGITKFCVHPNSWFRSKTRVGGTKQLNIPGIRKLQPDLVIANREENTKEQIEELTGEFPVWISNVNNLDDAYAMIESMGRLINRVSTANLLLKEIKSAFDNELPSSPANLRTTYFIWKDPYMTVGEDTFIHDMMLRCGMKNLFEGRTRYPTTSIAELSTLKCELLLLSSEPYPFKQKHIEEIRKELPQIKMMLVDGEMFSWYGSRLKYAPAYFKQLRELVLNC